MNDVDGGPDATEVDADLSPAELFTEPAVVRGGDGVWRASLVFDRVMPGLSNRQTLRLGHVAGRPLEISRFFIREFEECDRVAMGIAPDEPFPDRLDDQCTWSVDAGQPLPLELADEAFTEYSLGYRPNSLEDRGSAVLVLETNAPAMRSIEVALHVESGPPRIVATPPDLSFDVNTGAESVLQVHNRGIDALEVESIRVQLESDSAIDPMTGEPVSEFSFGRGLELPSTLGPNELLEIRVIYTPVDDLPDRGVLTLQSNDPESPMLVVPFTSAE